MPYAPSFPLWPEGAPGALGDSEHDIPTLTARLPDPDIATGTAVVIFPGGGYSRLADHEGAGYAEWLNKHGIAAFVLKYRLGSHGYRHPAMLQDAARATRMVRSLAGEFPIDPARIGIMGSSAGGHLATTLLTHCDDGNPSSADPIEHESSRPDLAILCYAHISYVKNFNLRSRDILLGDAPAEAASHAVSAEFHVTEHTAPCFLWHTWEDPTVDVTHSIDFAAAIRSKGVRFELHIYEKGRHGMGLGKDGVRHRWTDDLLAWLRERDFAR